MGVREEEVVSDKFDNSNQCVAYIMAGAASHYVHLIPVCHLPGIKWWWLPLEKGWLSAQVQRMGVFSRGFFSG